MIERLQVGVPAGAEGELPSPGNFLCSYSVSVAPPCYLLLQWHIKDPGHSAKSASGWFHRNLPTTLSKWSVSGLPMLSRHSVGTYQVK